MRVVVLGANGGVGRRAVSVSAEAGYQVVAAARTLTTPSSATSPATPQGVARVVVDVRDPDAVRRVVEGADAVLWCVGVTKRSGPQVGADGLPLVVAAVAEHGVSRLVTVSGAGVTLPGDQKSVGARLASGLTRRLAADMVADEEAEHQVLAASGVAWTEVRPPRLVDPEPDSGTDRAGAAWVLVSRPPGLTAKPVTKTDVARAMLYLAGSTDWVRRSPFLVTR